MEHNPNKSPNPNNTVSHNGKTIIVAGATGDLGKRIISCLLHSGAAVKALVRKGTNPKSLVWLQKKGVLISEVDFNSHSQLVQACSGASCLVSALSGLEEVILGVQTQLLQAAIEAGIPRFIPSDYCIDYKKLSFGSNRNLDLRHQFNDRINKAPVVATSILNGMFTDLLTGQAPIILFGLRRILYWGDAEQLLDFTTVQNTAEYTACAILDDATPRYLRIAGEVINVKGLRTAATEVTGKEFHLFKAGELGRLRTMIKITRALLPKKKEVFPPWQGMQYMHDMFTGLPKLAPLDNNRYSHLKWTSVREVLSRSGSKQ
jgi:nucleoside-diphosphate-sugar epimerase